MRVRSYKRSNLLNSVAELKGFLEDSKVYLVETKGLVNELQIGNKTLENLTLNSKNQDELVEIVLSANDDKNRFNLNTSIVKHLSLPDFDIVPTSSECFQIPRTFGLP